MHTCNSIHIFTFFIQETSFSHSGFLRGCTMPAVAVTPVASPPWALSHHFWGGEAGSRAGSLLLWETAGRSPLSINTCLLCPWAQITVLLVFQASCESYLFLQCGGNEKTLKKSCMCFLLLLSLCAWRGWDASRSGEFLCVHGNKLKSACSKVGWFISCSFSIELDKYR